MLVTLDNLSPTCWENIRTALNRKHVPEIPCEYLIRFQEVHTPGHTIQIHIVPNCEEASGSGNISDRYCWEVIVSDDSRFGRYCAVCAYFESPAKEVFLNKMGVTSEVRERYEKSAFQEKFRYLQKWFAERVLEEIFENIKFN